MNESGVRVFTGHCTAVARLRGTSPDHPSVCWPRDQWRERTRNNRHARRADECFPYDDFQFSLAEKGGVVERFEYGRVGIFQCRVFAHESDDHFFV